MVDVGQDFGNISPGHGDKYWMGDKELYVSLDCVLSMFSSVTLSKVNPL